MKKSKLILLLIMVALFGANAIGQDITGSWRGKFRDERGKRWKIKMYVKNSNGNSHFGVVRISRVYRFLHYPLFILGEFPLPYSAEFTVAANSSANGFGFSCKNLIRSKGKRGFKWCQVVSGSLQKKKDNKYKGKFSGCFGGGFLGYNVRPYGDGRIRMSKSSNEIPQSYSEFIDRTIRPNVEIESIEYVNNQREAAKNIVKANSFGYILIKLHNKTSEKVDYRFTVKCESTNAEASLKNGSNGYEQIPSYSSIKLPTPIATYNEAFVMPGQNGTSHTIQIQLVTGYKLPDSLRFAVILINRNGEAKIKEQSFAFATSKFIEENNIRLPLNGVRSAALNSYYGAGIPNYGLFANLLADLKQDAKAEMWRAYFIYSGRGGFEKDEFASNIIANKYITQIMDSAEAGDLESYLLLALAYNMRVEPESWRNTDLARSFKQTDKSKSIETILKLCHEKKYIPGSFEYAMYLMYKRYPSYKDAYVILYDLYQKGIGKAGLYLGLMYENGWGVKQDISEAIAFYKKQDEAGDLEATAILASCQFKNKEYDLAVKNVNRGIEKGSTRAMFIYANHFACKKPMTVTDWVESIRLLKEASLRGNTDAMMALGLVYLKCEIDSIVNERLGMTYIENAAKAGNTEAMQILCNEYAEGKILNQNMVLFRYWQNQLYFRGIGNGPLYDVKSEPLTDLFYNIDLSPTRFVKEYDGQGNFLRSYYEGPSAFEIIGGTFANTYANTHRQRQDIINGIEPVMEKEGSKVYAITISSAIKTNLYLMQGDQLKFNATGWVECGTWAGTRNPNGHRYQASIFDAAFNDVNTYNIATNCIHGSLIARTGSSEWSYIGKKRIFNVQENGTLTIAANDSDPVGNKGYFDVEVIR